MPARLEMMRLAAWICVVTLAVLSLWPAPTVIRTGLGGHVEHVFAYAATAIIVALGYNELGLPRIVALLLATAALLEYLQRYTGRHSEFADFLFSSTGVFIGVIAFALAEFLIRAGRRRPARVAASYTWQDRARWRTDAKL
jgi:VanZ family protein